MPGSPGGENLPQQEEDENDEDGSLEQTAVEEESVDKVNFRDLFAYACSAFPDAKADIDSPPTQVGFSQLLEKFCGRSTSSQGPPPRFKEHQSTEKTWSKLLERWPALASSGKNPNSLLPKRSSFYNTQKSFDPPSCNKEIERKLQSQVNSKRTVPLSVDSCRRIEQQMLYQRDMSSFMNWMIQVMMNMFFDPDIDHRTSPLFQQVVQSLQLVSDSQGRSAAAVYGMMQLSRRELFVSHLPCHVPRASKDDLLASPLSRDSLFDSEVVKRVLDNLKEDTAMAANVTIAYTKTHSQHQPVQRQQFQQQHQQPQTSYRGLPPKRRGAYRGRKNRGRGGRGGQQAQNQTGGSKGKPNARGFRK